VISSAGSEFSRSDRNYSAAFRNRILIGMCPLCMLRTAEEGQPSLPLQRKIVNSYFFSKHFMDYETPHPTSFLGHLLPRGEGRAFPTLSRGERVSAMRRRVRGQFTDLVCGRQAALHCNTVISCLFSKNFARNVGPNSVRPGPSAARSYSLVADPPRRATRPVPAADG